MLNQEIITLYLYTYLCVSTILTQFFRITKTKVINIFCKTANVRNCLWKGIASAHRTVAYGIEVKHHLYTYLYRLQACADCLGYVPQCQNIIPTYCKTAGSRRIPLQDSLQRQCWHNRLNAHTQAQHEVNVITNVYTLITPFNFIYRLRKQYTMYGTT